MPFQKHIATLYNQYVDQLYSYALHLGFKEDIAMDAIHDLFFKLCTKHGSLDEINNLKSYLFKSLKNRLIDIYREQKECVEIFSTNGDEYEELPFQIDFSFDDKLIEEEDLEEIRTVIRKVLNDLTERQREIIYLRYVYDYEFNEIAELLQISVESCRNSISKSFRKIRMANPKPNYSLFIKILFTIIYIIKIFHGKG